MKRKSKVQEDTTPAQRGTLLSTAYQANNTSSNQPAEQ